MDDVETTSRITLSWSDIFDRSEKIGKIFITAEIIKMSDESVNESIVPLLKNVQPKLRDYQSVFSIKIVHVYRYR